MYDHQEMKEKQRQTKKRAIRILFIDYYKRGGLNILKISMEAAAHRRRLIKYIEGRL